LANLKSTRTAASLEIGVYSQKLTEAMKLGHWDEARLDAAILAFMWRKLTIRSTPPRISMASVKSNWYQRAFWNHVNRSLLVVFPMRPNDGSFINDPTDHAFEACLRAHSWLEVIQVRIATRAWNPSLTTMNISTALQSIRWHADPPTLGRRNRRRSYWLTAWTNAGKPALPH